MCFAHGQVFRLGTLRKMRVSERNVSLLTDCRAEDGDWVDGKGGKNGKVVNERGDEGLGAATGVAA